MNLIKINILTMFLIIKIKLLMMVLGLGNSIWPEFGIKDVRGGGEGREVCS